MGKGSIEDVRETNIAADIAAIAALDTAIAGLTGEDKIAKGAEKATKEAEKLTKETERDVSFKKMMNEIAQEKASVTMAAAMRAKPDMTEREKLDAVKIEMKKSLANDEAISDSKVRDFVKKGAIKKAREVAKTAKGATKKETRDSVQAAMKESLGKPDKLVGGVYVSQVTETDVELFLEEAAIDEVDSVLSSCVESGDRLANGYDATTALGDCETKAKAAFKAFRGGEEAAIDAEITALNTAIASASGADKIAKEAEKATKEHKKKLKTREIEYTYTKSKQDAGRKNALAGVKAKMEIAKTAGTDMNSAAFKEETRAMAKRAFKASMAVADIEDAEMEELLKETSKKEASDQLDAAYEMAESATTDADIRTAFPGAGAKIDAYKSSLDTANTKLDTDIAAAQAAGKTDEVTKFQTEKDANLAKKTTVPAAELKKIKKNVSKIPLKLRPKMHVCQRKV